MLIRFSVENFLCFKDEVTLSLIASSDDRHPSHILPASTNRAPLLRATGIYGANGHGKTKLVEAMGFLERLVVDATSEAGYPPVRTFKFARESRGKPSRFVIEFRVGSTDYEFGVVLDSQLIHEEWLFARFNKRAVLLYERARSDKSDRSSGIKFGPKLKAAKSPNRRFKTEDYLEFLATGVSERRLFLNEASEKGISQLDEPIKWFRENLFVISAEAAYGYLHSRADKEADFLPFLAEFVSHADTGIEGLSLERTKLSQSALQRIDEQTDGEMLKSLAELEPGEELLIGGSDGPEVALQKDELGDIYSLSFVTQHRSDGEAIVALDLTEESAGTRRLIDLLPMMSPAEGSIKTFVVDELDRKLHPLLAYRFLESLLKCPDAQVIFTTHNTLLLDLDLLRRDEIWFAQKRKDQSVDLYSLAEFKVRPDLDIRKGYLNGRFGAIPFLGNLADIGWCESRMSVRGAATNAD